MSRILLLGNYGREMSLARALKKSDIELINWAPHVNPGIKKLADRMIVSDYDTTIEDLDLNQIDIAILGPENPIIEGMADKLERSGIKAFGPTARNARIEGSKIYMRQLLERHNIPGNANFRVCSTQQELIDALEADHQIAVKPDGLTHGKGVKVYGSHLKTKEMVMEYAMKLLQSDGVVLLEELLTGTEFSLQAIVCGDQMLFFPFVKDYKRAYDNDVGSNTGSMGSCSFPDHILPYLDNKQIDEVKSIMRKVVQALKSENGEYVGFLYGQFMLTQNGIRVVEFNARLGDPEAINVLELLERPLLELITDLCDGINPEVSFRKEATICVYLAPEGYPEEPIKGALIDRKLLIEQDIIASVNVDGDIWKSTKSRAIAFIGHGETLNDARQSVYNRIPKHIGKLRYRRDIGREFL